MPEAGTLGLAKHENDLDTKTDWEQIKKGFVISS
jgi:hypothetical protein